MTRYYLDTTVQVERHAGDRTTRDAVQSRLLGGRHATSTHVEREWKRIMEVGATEVLNVVREAGGLQDVAARLGQGGFRRPGQRWRVIAAFVGDDLTLDTLELRAQTFLRSTSAAMFRAGIDTVRDSSECSLVGRRAEQDRKGRWELVLQCRKAECQCVHDSFVAGSRGRIEAAAEALAGSSDDGHRKMARNSRAVIASKKPLDAKGKNCWGGGGPGGDIAIALECAEDETLLTTDRSFDLICPALAIRHERIPPTPPP